MFDNRQDTIYFKTYAGNFTREVEENTPGALVRKAEKTGRKITYLAYNRITGYINSIKYRKHEHDGIVYRDLIIEMQSRAGRFNIDFNVFGNAARYFFHVMESINPALEVQLDIKRSGERDSLFVSQPDGKGKMVTLKWNYTKDAPGERPDWKKQTDSFGTEKWDNTAEIAWFIDKVPDVNEIFENHWALSAPATIPANIPADPIGDMDIPEGPPVDDEEPPQTDDLPF